MARETWSVYSARDHLAPFAFASDMLLYDRVRVAVPAEADFDRWVQAGWQPTRQERLLEMLGDRAQTVIWRAEVDDTPAEWTAPPATPLPGYVTGVDTVRRYQGLMDLTKAVELSRPLDDPAPGAAAVVISWDFAVPEQLYEPSPTTETELEVLAEVIEVTGGAAFRRHRRAFWRWARELMSGTVHGAEAIDDAAEELDELVEEQTNLAYDAWPEPDVRTGLLLGTITVDGRHDLAPVTLAGAALSVGRFTRSGTTTVFCEIDRRTRERVFEV
jgi:hypothetical protein